MSRSTHLSTHRRDEPTHSEPSVGMLALAICALALIVYGAFVKHADASPIYEPELPKQSARASCYGPGLIGNHTASGQILHRWTIGVAHRTAPLGSRITIRYRGRVVRTRVIDRGPFVHGRTLDLTEALVRKLGVNGCTAWGVRSVRTHR